MSYLIYTETQDYMVQMTDTNGKSQQEADNLQMNHWSELEQTS